MSLPTAIATAMFYHRHQEDKAGHPFVGHPLRVLGYVAEETANTDVLSAAVLHDVVEDTPCTYQDLYDLGFSDKVVGLVEILTHVDGDTYMDYVRRIPRGGPDAILIKMSDLKDNLDERRGDFLNRESIDQRHLKAQLYLRSELDRIKAPVSGGMAPATTGESTATNGNFGSSVPSLLDPDDRCYSTNPMLCTNCGERHDQEAAIRRSPGQVSVCACVRHVDGPERPW